MLYAKVSASVNNYQCCGCSATYKLIADRIALLYRSTFPFERGWYGVVKLLQIPNTRKTFCMNLLLIGGPLSDRKVVGNP